MPITIKSEREIELMTEAGRILGIVHKELERTGGRRYHLLECRRL